MHLLVVHYHWRPGGVRHVVESAIQSLAADPRSPVRHCRLAAGEPPPEPWARSLQDAAGPDLPLDWVTEPWLAYASEGPGGPEDQRDALVAAATRLVRRLPAPRTVLLENPAVGRHPWISHAFAEACAATGTRLLCHHHDFFIDGRWAHWAAWTARGHGSLTDALAHALPAGPHLTHLTVTARDTAWVSRFVPAVFCPNPVAAAAPPSAAEISRARTWLHHALGSTAPVWLCPTRTLRRKNLLEAALLARLLAPDAAVATTAGVSSPAETRYARALEEAAARGDIRLALGLRAAAEAAGRPAPSIPSLMAASDAVVVPSLFEGFGLPVLEASNLGIRCLARLDACPDGRPPPGVCAYDEIRVPWDLGGGKAERARQETAWLHWRHLMPTAAAAALPDPPWWTGAATIPFSRLTLEGQLETLRACQHPETAAAMRALNPGLPPAPARPSPPPPAAPPATTLIDQLRAATPAAAAPVSVSPHVLLDHRLAWANHYPLLWPGGDTPAS